MGRDELDSDSDIGLTQAEINYYEAMRDFPQGEYYAPGEVACVGAGIIGGGFANTMELHVMKYDQAVNGPEAKEWAKAVEEEHKRMLNHEVFQTVPRDDVPKGPKILTSTWAMKKVNRVHRARLNARGYEQVDGKHYDEDSKFAPVVNDATIHIVLILLIMAGWYAELINVKGAFLHGIFEKGRKVYMEVPQGFEQFYLKNCVLLLLKTQYGTKQVVKAFWLKLLKALQGMHYMRSKADPCLYYLWEDTGLVIWLSWVDDCLICSEKASVIHKKRK
jgi:hypothetical protein